MDDTNIFKDLILKVFAEYENSSQVYQKDLANFLKCSDSKLSAMLNGKYPFEFKFLHKIITQCKPKKEICRQLLKLCFEQNGIINTCSQLDEVGYPFNELIENIVKISVYTRSPIVPIWKLKKEEREKLEELLKFSENVLASFEEMYFQNNEIK